MKHVIYAANQFGYTVQLMDGDQIVKTYNAGNHRRESQTYVDPRSDNALTEKQILIFAEKTARAFAKENGTTVVEYDDDLEESIADQHG